MEASVDKGQVTVVVWHDLGERQHRVLTEARLLAGWKPWLACAT